jgi:BirA family biotin operon repressor/biotin-[acetyl-CoA-carboxylase] ligase
MIEGRKAAGILIESGPARAGGLWLGGLWLAVGIGVNLASHPDNVERPATALAEHAPAPSPDQAMIGLSTAFAHWLDLWLQDGLEPIRAAWTARAWGLGGPCTARLPHETVEGTALGLDADGALLVRLPGGELRRITAGDVFFGAT